MLNKKKNNHKELSKKEQASVNSLEDPSKDNIQNIIQTSENANQEPPQKKKRSSRAFNEYSDEEKTKRSEEFHQKNWKTWGFDFQPHVTIISVLLIVAFLVFCVGFQSTANHFFSLIQTSMSEYGNWFFIFAVDLFVGYALYLGFSRFGEIRLGGPDARPEYSTFAWYSMLMSAGMGIGLMFWSVGEPVDHFITPMPIFSHLHGPYELAIASLGTSFYHWGLHPWGVYSLVGLSLAFFSYNRNLPLSLRSVFFPIWKEKIWGWPGHIIDIMAILACLFGLATSLGFGAQQISSGLNYLFHLPITMSSELIIVAVITMIAMFSVASGIGRGVRILSMVNIWVALAFMLCILFLGPTLYLLRAFINSVGFYFHNLLPMSFFANMDPTNHWQSHWTVFYWAWWISWSPFVGTFIAVVSKGRTVREFIIAVMIVPSLLSFFWISVIGGTAIHQQIHNSTLYHMVQNNLPVALFAMIQHLSAHGLPFIKMMHFVLSLVGVVLVVCFFVTSADSGSLVVDQLVSGGKSESPRVQRLFWASSEGIIAIVLLIVGGKESIQALQTASILTGAPFALVLILMCYSLYRGLHSDHQNLQIYKQERMMNHFLKFFYRGGARRL